MEKGDVHLEMLEKTYHEQWQKLVAAGVTVQQITDFLGRPDLLLKRNLPGSQTPIFIFDIKRFIGENIQSLNPIELPDPSFFIEKPQESIFLKKLSLITGIKERLWLQLAELCDVPVEKLPDGQQYITLENIKKIIDMIKNGNIEEKRLSSVKLDKRLLGEIQLFLKK